MLASPVAIKRWLFGAPAEFEMVAEDEGTGGEGSEPPVLQRKPVLDGRSLQYSVKVIGRAATAWGAEPPPHPALFSFAPFPYGTATAPTSWERLAQDPVYLSVPPLHDSNGAEQDYGSTLDRAGTYGGNADPSFIPSSELLQMSLTRRLGGCFFLLLLGVLPLLVMFHAAVHFRNSTGAAEKVVLCFVYLAVLLGGCHQLALEAQQSRLGMLLRADAVPVDDVEGYIDQCSADVALEINFKARRRRGELNLPWPYDHHEDASPPSKGVAAHVCDLSSAQEVVRLRLPVRVGLADDQTRGDFITALHSFYLKTKDEYPSLAVEVRRQNHVVVITRAETGLPRSFRAMQAIFSVSVYLTLSWIPRVVVLLFFPQWVDPAYSPVYFYRKLLVSRPVG